MDSSQKRFESLEDLIQEYSSLIKENTDRLGIHIEFDMYKDRSQNVIEKIKKITDTEEGEIEKIKHIVEFTIYSGAKSDLIVKYKDDTLTITPTGKNYIHSYSNAARLTTALKNTKEDEDKNTVLDGDDILKYGKLIIDVLEYFQKDIEKTASDFWEENQNYDKSFLKNNPQAPFDELKFWYFSANKEDTTFFDEFALVNGSLNTAIKYLGSIYPNGNLTIENIHSKLSNKLKDKDINLPAYLYLDQLCNLIHKLKPNEIKEENIKDGKNKTEIFEFYQKLWNTIQPVKQIDLQNELNKFKNIIYHGAPGTGKTYQLKEEINEHISIQGGGKYEFIQFHGSYYYEDFIGGLKPIDGEHLTLKYKNGIFKQLCKEAAKYEIAYYKKVGNDEELTENTKASKDIELNIDNNQTIVIKKGQSILSLFPPFFIIIDEINRADLSKVFGELLFAIEDDYRGFKHKFKLSSSNMEDKDTAVYWEEEKGEAYFFVPKNLYIRGTMNDIDKSVDSIDFAFRRRFKWIEKKFDKKIISEIIEEKGYESLDFGDYLNKCSGLNNKITNEISIADESFKIGHAIFANIIKYLNSNNEISKTSKEQLFDNHIEPILYNYLKMDYGNSIDINDFKKDFIS